MPITEHTCMSLPKKKKKKECTGSSRCGIGVMNPTSVDEDASSIPGLPQWVKDLELPWLWCRIWQLGSGITVAVVWAGSCSFDLIPSLGTSVCHGCGPKKTKNK